MESGICGKSISTHSRVQSALSTDNYNFFDFFLLLLWLPIHIIISIIIPLMACRRSERRRGDCSLEVEQVSGLLLRKVEIKKKMGKKEAKKRKNEKDSHSLAGGCQFVWGTKMRSAKNEFGSNTRNRGTYQP